MIQIWARAGPADVLLSLLMFCLVQSSSISNPFYFIYIAPLTIEIVSRSFTKPKHPSLEQTFDLTLFGFVLFHPLFNQECPVQIQYRFCQGVLEELQVPWKRLPFHNRKKPWGRAWVVVGSLLCSWPGQLGREADNGQTGTRNKESNSASLHTSDYWSSFDCQMSIIDSLST